MKRKTNKGFTLVELMVVIGILGLLVGILAVAVIPKLADAQSKLEIKQVGDLINSLQQVNIDGGNLAKLRQAPLKDAKGQAFYENAIRKKLLEADTINKLVSLATKVDTKASDWDPQGTEKMPEHSCSYTSPKGADLQRVLKLTGKDKTVVLTFNSENWTNYDDGVIIFFSGADQAEYMAPDVAQDTWKIDQTSFKSAGGGKDIIGQKAPFNNTFE